jgi:hypothetical protein
VRESVLECSDEQLGKLIHGCLLAKLERVSINPARLLLLLLHRAACLSLMASIRLHRLQNRSLAGSVLIGRLQFRSAQRRIDAGQLLANSGEIGPV